MSFNDVSKNLGSIQPETKSIAHEIYDAAAAEGHDIWAMWGMGGPPEHSTGLALDLMVRNSAAGTWIRNYIWANRERLRLRHVIWSQHITSTVTQPGVVRAMEDRGSPTENHMDHNHVLLFAGAYRAPAGSSTPPATGGKSVTDIANEVLRGDWGNGPDRVRRLIAAGYSVGDVQAEVDRMLGIHAPSSPPLKTVGQVAQEVLEGKWGNGDDRYRRLLASPYSQSAVQNEVDRILGVHTPGKTVHQVALEVIAGKWGDGDERYRRLLASPYSQSAVQAEVNRIS